MELEFTTPWSASRLAFSLRRVGFCKSLRATVDLPRFHETRSDLSLVWHNCSLPHFFPILSHAAFPASLEPFHASRRLVIFKCYQSWIQLEFNELDLIELVFQNVSEKDINHVNHINHVFAFSIIDLSKNHVKADRNLLMAISLFDIYTHEGNKTRGTVVVTVKHVTSRDGI